MIKNNPARTRFLITSCAVCLGVVACALEMITGAPPQPPQQPDIAIRRTPEEDRLILDACIVFFTVVYATGGWLYRWCGAEAERNELRNWSRYHMFILKLMGGLWLIASGWPAQQRAIFLRPSLVVGILLVASAAYSFGNQLRMVYRNRS